MLESGCLHEREPLIQAESVLALEFWIERFSPSDGWLFKTLDSVGLADSAHCEDSVDQESRERKISGKENSKA